MLLHNFHEHAFVFVGNSDRDFLFREIWSFTKDHEEYQVEEAVNDLQRELPKCPDSIWAVYDAEQGEEFCIKDFLFNMYTAWPRRSGKSE